MDQQHSEDSSAACTGYYYEASSGHCPDYMGHLGFQGSFLLDGSYETTGFSSCPSVGRTTPLSKPGSSKISASGKGKAAKNTRGGNDTRPLPRHPDPKVERKRDVNRGKNRIYQSTSRAIKEASLKSALAQIGMVWEFFHVFQQIESRRNVASMSRYRQLMKERGEGPAERNDEWREKERQLEELNYSIVKGAIRELELRMKIEGKKQAQEESEIRQQAKGQKQELLSEKGLVE